MRRLTYGFVFILAAAACSTDPMTDPVDPALGEDGSEIQAGKIENGYPAVGMVLITLPSGKTSSCTGTLISPSVVLTAKHCHDSENILFRTGTSTSDFVDRPVSRIIDHPSRDLLILTLVDPIRDITPLTINTGALPAAGTTCTAVGFGIHNTTNLPDSGVTSGRKRSATEDVLSSNTSTILVTKNSGLADSGDSGGPLLCDGRIAGVVWRHTDGDWPTHTQEIYTTMDADWVADVASDFSTEPLIAAVSRDTNRLDLFHRGIDGHTYVKYWDGAWGPSGMAGAWMDLGGVALGTPEAISWAPNRIDLFTRGRDLALYHKWWDGTGWKPSQTGAWESLGGELFAHPAVASWGANRLDLFHVGQDGKMYHKWFDGTGWGPSLAGAWENLGGAFQGPVKAVSRASGRIDVFAVGNDDKVYTKSFNASTGWSPSLTGAWTSLGGTAVGTPSVVSWGSSRIDVFVKGQDAALYHKWWDGSWHPSQAGSWEDLGGELIGSPVAVSRDVNRIDVFVRNEGPLGNVIETKSFNGSNWSPLPQGFNILTTAGTTAGPLSAVSWGPSRLDVFSAGSDMAAKHLYWAGGTRWEPPTILENLAGILSW